MCGLFGWHLKPGAAAKRPVTMKLLALSLMAHNDRRGGDSWGYYGPEPDVLVRDVGNAVSMTRRQLDGLASLDVAIGHTRRATTGDVSEANAHPFDHGGVVGAHNGMVTNHAALCAAYDRDFEVDSQHIFAHLDEGLPVSEIEAYGAVAYHSRAVDRSVYLGTAHDGELALAKVPGLGLVWSSRAGALADALETAGIGDWWDVPLEDGALYRITRKGTPVVVDLLDFAEPVFPWKLKAAEARAATGEAFDLSDPELEWELPD